MVMDVLRQVRRGQPENTSAEEQAMREVVAVWARDRWGADMRIIHELALRDRRIDMLCVPAADLIGIEIKGPRDRLDDDRLPGQLKEYGYFLPEVWLIVHKKWTDHRMVASARVNLAVLDGDRLEVRGLAAKDLRKAARDEMCCSRLIELLWNAELYRMAKRAGVPVEIAPGKMLPPAKARAMMARTLTGHEIVKGVCLELRNRPLVGMASDEVVSERAPP